ncbi:5-bromo-4-chloroindolyl phosphate hydrolysis family protein [Lachnospiraceae bacterium LCP25S3_G4]
MPGQDWNNLGDDIRNIVQHAIDSQNFDKLNQTINSTINTAMNTAVEGIEKGLKGAGKVAEESIKYANPKYMEYKNGKGKQNIPSLYAKTTSSKVFGITFSAIGYSLSVALGLTILILSGIGAAIQFVKPGLYITAGILTPIFIGSVWMAWKGTTTLSRISRHQTYRRHLGERTYCNIKELADTIRKSPKFVKKDLHKMIQNGWFIQGHLDKQETCLMVSDDAYAQYQEAQKQWEMQQELVNISNEKKEPKEWRQLSPEVQKVITEGNDYISKIRRSNDAILGEEISLKISRMELLVQKIFHRIEQHPEHVDDISKLMDYYLPTTVKLLDAYEELSAQPIQGENIVCSLKEIEHTLDTLNIAFEKLLDGLFKETAWDVSTDISVLNTMLAQEGLTKDIF